MVSLKGKGEVMLGLFVDGLDIKLACLSRQNNIIYLHELKEATLVRRLEEQSVLEATGGSLTETDDAFHVTGAVSAASNELEDRGVDSNNSVVLSLLTDYPPSKYYLTYSVSEPSIFYHTMESTGGLKGDRLKARILDDLQSTRSFQPDKEAVNYIETEEGTLLSIVREDGLQLVNIFEDIKSFIGNRIPKIHSIMSSDIVLINLVKMNYDFLEDEISIIAYVGVEFSRIIFMRGNHFLHFGPIIGEGYESPMLQNTLYSRILLEQDNLALPKIDRIILTGKCHDLDLRTILGPQFADVEVELLKIPTLDTRNYFFEGDLDSHLSEFVVPIATAWSALESKNKFLYKLDLLPASIREKLKLWRIGWHGYLMFLLLIIIGVYFGQRITGQLNAEVSQKEMLQLKQRQLEENIRLQFSTDSLRTQIGKYSASMTVFDSIVPGADRWSKMLTSVANGLEDLSSIWFTNIKSTPTSGMIIDGISVYRARVPRVANLFPDAILRKVTTSKIRDKDVYQFEIEIPPPKPVNQPAHN